jgi:alpha-mannosidase
MTYALPASLTDDRKGRSPERVDCEIVTRASVYPRVARVDVETEVENGAKDHRLRLHFPTGIKADRSCAEQHFGAVERPVGLPEYDGTWLETPVAFYPQKSFVDISDPSGEGHGFMLANRGLPEYEALRADDGAVTIALTLVRCVEWLSRQDLATRHGHAGPGMHTPGAQMIGRWKFQYSLIPHEGGWEKRYAEAHRFVRPMRAVRVSRGSGGLPEAGSLIEIEPAEVILSALKVAEDDGSIIARVYNIGSQAVEARVALRVAFGRVERVDLNEERPEAIPHEDSAVRLDLKTNEIATLKFS